MRWSQIAATWLILKSIELYHMEKAVGLAEEAIISKIYLIRGLKVMIDRDWRDSTV